MCGELDAVLAELYRGAGRIDAERGGAGDPLTVRIAVERAPDLAALLERAEAAAS